jgi:small subunit ribosomal protein S2
VIADAVAAGLQERSANVAKEATEAAKAGADSVAAGEPLADWEKELLGNSASEATDNKSNESAGA